MDQRTFYEIYVPHFMRAIDADVGSFMCSYNRVNDTHACQNDEVLNKILKKQLGFKWWVMSDWGATHSSAKSANSGLDQEMFLWLYFGFQLQFDVKKGLSSIDRVEDMNRRILTQMFKFGIFDRPKTGNVSSVATSPEHVQLAREFAAESTVLLKN